MRLLFLKPFKDLIGGFYISLMEMRDSKWAPFHVTTQCLFSLGKDSKTNLKSNRESAMTKAVLAVDIEFVDKMNFTWRNTYMELVTYHLSTSNNRTFSTKLTRQSILPYYNQNPSSRHL